MFKAMTNKNKPSTDARGTLSALWGKKTQSKLNEGAPEPTDDDPGQPAEGSDAPMAGEQAEQAEGEDQRTPEPACRPDQERAEPVTVGDAAAAATDTPAEPGPVGQGPAEEEEVIIVDDEGKPPQAAKQAKPGGGSVCKKRARGEDFSQEQLVQLEALFASNQYANMAAKQGLADKLGMDVALVNKWFEKQRKKARLESGAVAKRGRPKSASGGAPGKAKASGANGLVADEEVEAVGAAATGMTSADASAPGAEAQQAGEQQDVEAAGGEVPMEVDGADAAAVPQQEQAQQEQVQQVQQQQVGDETMADLGGEGAPVAATPAPAGQSGCIAAAAAVDGVDAEVQPTPAGGTATEAAAEGTPALPAKGTAEEPVQPSQAVTPGAAPAAAAAAAEGSTASAARASTAKPTPALPQHVLSGEEKEKLVGELTAEAQRLQQEGLAEPLQAIPSGPQERLPFSDAKLASYVAGQRLPLSQLVSALLPVFKAPEGEAPVEEAVLRSKVIDLAARKSCAPKDGGSSLVDALEDGEPSHLWQWEVRDGKVLPKELRPTALAAKKRAAKVQERLTAVGVALKQLEGHKEGKAAARLNRALEGLNKTKTLDQIVADLEAEQAQHAAKSTAKKAAASAAKPKLTEEEKEQAKAEKEAEKERAKAEKEAEKERQKAEKEAEKERQRAEKEAEKERHKAEKEAEKERQKKEAEAQKQLKKTGFKDATALNKTANKFASFFKPAAPQNNQQVAAGAGTGANTAATPLSSSATTTQQAASLTGTDKGATSAPGGATTAKKRERGFGGIFEPPPPEDMLPPLPSAAASMDGGLRQEAPGFEQLQEEWRQLVARTKRERLDSKSKHILGLPSPWARGARAREVAAQHVQRLLDSGMPASEIKVWRRKFLWFDGDKPYAVRPAFYGSRTQDAPAVGAVRPRNFLARDSSLDYEVMSDLDWEEEPEGEELSDGEGDAKSEISVDASEANDSFVVETGYLSEDEGIKSDAGEDDTEAESGELALAGAAVGGTGAAESQQRARKRQQLEVQLERARRVGKPYIISRLLPVAVPEGQPSPFIPGDVALLEGLAMEVLVPGVKITMPPNPAADAPAGQAEGPAGKAEGAKVGAAAGKLERPEELLPQLLAAMQANPKASKQKVVQEFLDAHKERRIVKKWVQDKIKELADWSGSQWVLKPEGCQLLGQAPAGAACTAGADVAAAAPAQQAPASDPPQAAKPEAADAAKHAAAADVAAEGPVATEAPAAHVTPVQQPLPARQQPPAAGPMDRFLQKGPKTPAVPAGLQPEHAPSSVQAPEGLAMAAGNASLQPPLEIPQQVASTSDPYWHSLLCQVEGADSCCAGSAGQRPVATWPFEAAFAPDVLSRHVGAIPAFIVTALVAGLSSSTITAGLRASYMQCLSRAVAALGKQAAAAVQQGEEATTPSQQVWATSNTSPLPASLKELCREPHLLPALQACVGEAAVAVSAAVDAAQGGVKLFVQQEVLAAARAALEVAAAVVGDAGLRGTLLEAAGCGGEAMQQLGKAAGAAAGAAAWLEDAALQGLVVAVRRAVDVCRADAPAAMELDS